MTVSDADKLEAALAACIASGGSVKAHAKTHGVPVASLRRRWEAHRGNRPPVREDHPAGVATRGPSRARTPAHAREEEQDDGFDPLTATVVQRLEHQFSRAYETARALNRENNRTLARQWEITAADLGQQLDAARRADREEAQRRADAEISDPVELAKRLLAKLPDLCRQAPAEAEACWLAIGRTLGKLEDPADSYTPPDEATPASG